MEAESEDEDEAVPLGPRRQIAVRMDGSGATILRETGAAGSQGRGGSGAAPIPLLRQIWRLCTESWQPENLRSLLESQSCALLMTLCTVISLLGDNIRLGAVPKSYDPAFEVLNTVVLSLFLLEIVLSVRAIDGYLLAVRSSQSSAAAEPVSIPDDQHGYRRSSTNPDPPPAAMAVPTVCGGGERSKPTAEAPRRWPVRPSFNFCVDVACVLLMLADPDFITLLPTPRLAHDTATVFALRASRVGTKTMRLIRVLRATGLVHRLLTTRRLQRKRRGRRKSSLGEAAKAQPEKRTGGRGASGGARRRSVIAVGGTGQPLSPGMMREPQAAAASEPTQPLAAESRIGLALSQASHRKVMVGAVLLLVAVPFLTYSPPHEAWAFTAGVLRAAADTGSADLLHQAATLVEPALGHVLYLQAGGKVLVEDRAAMASRRECDLRQLVDGQGPGLVVAVQDVRAEVQAEAQRGVAVTVLVSCVLMGLVLLIERDLNTLVVTPLAKMTDLIDRISRRPLEPVDVATLRLKDSSTQHQGLEPTLLLTTISKIGALVKVGLGEAGADIITRSLSDGRSGESQLNLTSSGKLVDSIFVFCDIRQFTDTTECLQEEVMLFVNRIASLLHDLVASYGGSPNKNVGDAFLLVWKLSGQGSDRRGPAATASADRALYCVLKFLLELELSGDYVCGSFSTAASQRLHARMPDYHVSVGFGLHVGWAVEGAIGSAQKIDASYLSPHVSLSESLQDLTKDYGVPLLFSDVFYHLLSPQARHHCRQLDAIAAPAAPLPSSSQPPPDKPSGMGLYTYDCDIDNIRRLLKQLAATAHTSSGDGTTPGTQRGSGKSLFFPATATMSATATQDPHLGHWGSSGGLKTTVKLPSPIVTDHRSPQSAWPSATAITPLAGQRALMASPRHGKASLLVEQLSCRAVDGSPARPYDTTVWEEDPALQLLRRHFPPGFRATWAFAMRSYLAGEWATARQGFETTLDMSGGRDQPSRHLLAVMDSLAPRHEADGQGGKAPVGWPGFRT